VVVADFPKGSGKGEGKEKENGVELENIVMS
jgi:hypothetical protein